MTWTLAGNMTAPVTDGSVAALIASGTTTGAALNAKISAGITGKSDKDALAIDLRDHGGVADFGVTDNSVAIQTCVDLARSTGRPISVPGVFGFSTPPVLPTDKPITFVAAPSDSNPFAALTRGVSTLVNTGSAVFTAADAVTPVQLNIEGVNFRNSGGSSAVLFNGVNLATSTIKDVTATGYDKIFANTDIGFTKVKDSRFNSIRTAFADANSSVIDSWITGNYINGALSGNATAFQGGWATSTLADNYFDFFKRVLDLPTGMTDVRIINNIFDYCWNTIGTSGSVFLSGFTVVGNTWLHCKASEANPLFTAEDADMLGTPYRAIDASGGMNRSTFTGNHFAGVDLAFRIRGGVGNIRESGTVFDDSTAANRFDVDPSFFTNAAGDIFLETLERTKATATFAAAQTVSFRSAAIIEITLTANMSSLTFAQMVPGGIYELHLIQDATGSRTLAGVASNIKFAGGSTPTLSTPAGRRDVFRFRYDGTNFNEIGRASAFDTKMDKASNLSDVASASTARTNLGLGSAATTAASAYDAAGAATSAQAAAIAASAQRASNLSDLASAATARTNLGLGTAATQASSAFDAAGAATAAQAAAIAASQPLDPDLTTIAALTATTDNVIQSVAGSWASRTMAQLKTALALVKGDVGLGNLDNTSDANKPVSTATNLAIAPRHRVWVTGEYYGCEGNYTPGTISNGDGLFAVIPFWVHVTNTITSIEAEVTTLSTGNLRMGIYGSNANDKPSGAPILDAGTVAATSIGVKAIAISQALAPGLYWLGVGAQGGSPTLRTIGTNTQPPVAGTAFASGGATSGLNCYYMASVSGALPTWGGLNVGSQGYRVMVKAG